MADQGGPAQPGGGGAAPQDGDLGEVRGDEADEADEAGPDEDTDGEGGGQGRDGEGVLIEVLEYLARNLVDNPDAVEVTTAQGDRGLVLRLRVDPEDMGKVIGRSGRTARALRTMVRAAGTRNGVSAFVEIVE